MAGPSDLKALVEACHARGLAVLLDVVYNHFGPEGNYLHVDRPDFFTERHHTPWGAAINYDGAASRPVRDFFIHNALYWLEEYHFDGLRLDAVHAIIDDSDARHPRPRSAQTVRARITDRPVHLVLENDAQRGAPPAPAATAGRSATRRSGTTICITCCMCWRPARPAAITATMPTSRSRISAARWPRALPIRASRRPIAAASRAASRRAICRRPPLSRFLQNHDQIGNTPFGERIAARAPDALVHAAVAIVLLSPQIPLLFMGEEWATSTAVHVLLRFRAGAGRCGARGASARVRAIPRIRTRRRRRAASRRDRRGRALRRRRLDWSEREREPHRTWLERYRRLLASAARRDRAASRRHRAGRRVPSCSGRRRCASNGRSATARCCCCSPISAMRRCRSATGRPARRLLYCTVAEPPADELAPSCASVLSDPAPPDPPGGETR